MDIINNFNTEVLSKTIPIYNSNNNCDNTNNHIEYKNIIKTFQEFNLINNTELKINSPSNDLFIGIKINIMDIEDIKLDVKFKIKNLDKEYILDSFIEDNLYKFSKYLIPISNNIKYDLYVIINFDSKKLNKFNKYNITYYYGNLSNNNKELFNNCPIFEFDKINIVCGYIYIK